LTPDRVICCTQQQMLSYKDSWSREPHKWRCGTFTHAMDFSFCDHNFNFTYTYAQYCNKCIAHMYNFPYKEFRSLYKIKWSLCTPEKRMANWRYSSTLYILDTWCRWAVSYTSNPIYSRWKKLGSLNRRLGEFQSRSGRWEKEKIFRSCRELHHYSPTVQSLVYSCDFASPGSLNLQDMRNFSVLHSNKICNFEHMKNIRRRW